VLLRTYIRQPRAPQNLFDVPPDTIPPTISPGITLETNRAIGSASMIGTMVEKSNGFVLSARA
jgi:hypothetical protein